MFFWSICNKCQLNLLLECGRPQIDTEKIICFMPFSGNLISPSTNKRP